MRPRIGLKNTSPNNTSPHAQWEQRASWLRPARRRLQQMQIQELRNVERAWLLARELRCRYGIAPISQQCPPDHAYVPHCFDLTTGARALQRIPELLHIYFLIRNISQHDDVWRKARNEHRCESIMVRIARQKPQTSVPSQTNVKRDQTLTLRSRIVRDEPARILHSHEKRAEVGTVSPQTRKGQKKARDWMASNGRDVLMTLFSLLRAPKSFGDPQCGSPKHTRS